MACSTVSKITPEGNSRSNWATVGSTPTDITIDGTGNIYTVSNGGGVSKITSQGVATRSWATTGSQPHGVVVDSAGNVYTANGGSNDVSKITPDGTVSTVDWGPVGHTHVTTGNKPYNITIDQAGNLYTTNELSNNVSKKRQKFNRRKLYWPAKTWLIKCKK
jgi:streptogramin lyase